MNQLAQKCQIPWWLTLIIVIETLPMFLGPVRFVDSVPGSSEN